MGSFGPCNRHNDEFKAQSQLYCWSPAADRWHTQDPQLASTAPQWYYEKQGRVGLPIDFVPKPV